MLGGEGRRGMRWKMQRPRDGAAGPPAACLGLAEGKKRFANPTSPRLEGLRLKAQPPHAYHYNGSNSFPCRGVVNSSGWELEVGGGVDVGGLVRRAGAEDCGVG